MVVGSGNQTYTEQGRERDNLVEKWAKHLRLYYKKADSQLDSKYKSLNFVSHKGNEN